MISVEPKGTMKSSHFEGLTNSKSIEETLKTNVNTHAWLVVRTMEFPGKTCPKKKNVKALQINAKPKNAKEPSIVRLLPTQEI